MTESVKKTKDEAEEKLLDHNYDGIHEADNPLPRWWVYMFVSFIVFAVVYLPVVHIYNYLPQNEMNRSIATAARIQQDRQIALEASGAFDQDPVAAGKKTFKTFCVTCHGSSAEGGLCPNLTDAFWIHGPYEKDILTTVTTGVAAKGMPAWGPVLGERKIKLLAAYVLTLWENPPPVKGKKPEGTEYNMAEIRGQKGGTNQVAADTTQTQKAKPVPKAKKKA